MSLSHLRSRIAFFQPFAQLSRFLSLLREINSGAAGPSQRVRVVSCRLSARLTCPPRVLSSRQCVSHKKTSAPLWSRMGRFRRRAWSPSPFSDSEAEAGQRTHLRPVKGGGRGSGHQVVGSIQWRFSKCFRPSFSAVWMSMAKYTRRLSRSCAQQQTWLCVLWKQWRRRSARPWPVLANLWLNLTEIRDAEKMAFLDSPVSPKGLFVPAVDGFAERFSLAQKTSQVLHHFLSKRPGPSDTDGNP